MRTYRKRHRIYAAAPAVIARRDRRSIVNTKEPTLGQLACWTAGRICLDRLILSAPLQRFGPRCHAQVPRGTERTDVWAQSHDDNAPLVNPPHRRAVAGGLVRSSGRCGTESHGGKGDAPAPLGPAQRRKAAVPVRQGRQSFRPSRRVRSRLSAKPPPQTGEISGQLPINPGHGEKGQRARANNVVVRSSPVPWAIRVGRPSKGWVG